MRKIGIILVILALTGFLSAEEKILRLGEHPFYMMKNLKEADIQKMASTRAVDIQKGFELASQANLATFFIAHLQTAQFEKVEIQPGEKLAWMMFKKARKVEVKSDLVWAGKKSFPAFKTSFFQDGTLYHFIIPVSCGNISLLQSAVIPPPACAVSVTPKEVEPGKPALISVCDTRNAVKSVVTVTANNGQTIKTMELTPGNCSAELTINDPGEYTISEDAEGQYGMKAEPCRVTLTVAIAPPPPPPPPPVDTKGKSGGKGVAGKKAHFLADLGFAQMKDPTNFLILRLGYQHFLSDDFRLNLVVGPWINLSNNFYKTPFSIDVTASYYLSDFIIGGGIGLWQVKDDSKIDLVLNAGYRIFDTEKFEGAILLEGRIGDFDDRFTDFSRYGILFRLTF